jgi:hypothetical protein
MRTKKGEARNKSKKIMKGGSAETFAGFGNDDDILADSAVRFGNAQHVNTSTTRVRATETFNGFATADLEDKVRDAAHATISVVNSFSPDAIVVGFIPEVQKRFRPPRTAIMPSEKPQKGDVVLTVGRVTYAGTPFTTINNISVIDPYTHIIGHQTLGLDDVPVITFKLNKHQSIGYNFKIYEEQTTLTQTQTQSIATSYTYWLYFPNKYAFSIHSVKWETLYTKGKDIPRNSKDTTAPSPFRWSSATDKIKIYSIADDTDTDKYNAGTNWPKMEEGFKKKLINGELNTIKFQIYVSTTQPVNNNITESNSFYI